MCIYPLLLGNFLQCWLDKVSEWFFRTGLSKKWRLIHADLPYGQDITETLLFFLRDVYTNPRSYVHSFMFNNIVEHTVHKSMLAQMNHEHKQRETDCIHRASPTVPNSHTECSGCQSLCLRQELPAEPLSLALRSIILTPKELLILHYWL